VLDGGAVEPEVGLCDGALGADLAGDRARQDRIQPLAGLPADARGAGFARMVGMGPGHPHRRIQLEWVWTVAWGAIAIDGPGCGRTVAGMMLTSGARGCQPSAERSRMLL
jgi:hypothetical protein